MTPWKKGERHQSWASNGNLAAYIFMVLFASWMFFQVWARLGGGPPPNDLTPMVMAALGVAITVKSKEERADKERVKSDVDQLKKFAAKTHPEVAEAEELTEPEGKPKPKRESKDDVK